MQVKAVSLQISALSARGSLGGYPLLSHLARASLPILQYYHYLSLQILALTQALSARGSLGGYPASAMHHYQDRRLRPQGLFLIIGIIVSIKVIKVIKVIKDIKVITEMSSSVILCIVYSCHRLPSLWLKTLKQGIPLSRNHLKTRRWPMMDYIKTFNESRSRGLYSPLVITGH